MGGVCLVVAEQRDHGLEVVGDGRAVDFLGNRRLRNEDNGIRQRDGISRQGKSQKQECKQRIEPGSIKVLHESNIIPGRKISIRLWVL